MLVEFKFENFRSFKNETFFTMEPPTQNGKNINVIKTDLKKISQLYRSIGIYGGNASGKSNFILALKLFQFLVKKSFKNEINKALPDEKYLLSKETLDKPTSFEMAFIYKNKFYKYGFKYTQFGVISEFLIYSDISKEGSARDNKIFIRDVKEGIKAKGIPQAWIEEVTNSRLFLSEIINNRNCQIEEIKNAYDYIANKLFITHGKPSLDFTLKMLQGENKTLIIKYLMGAGFGFQNINIKKVPTENILEELKNGKEGDAFAEIMIKKIMSGTTEFLDIKVEHRTEEGDIKSFRLEEESEGSKIFMSFIGYIVYALKEGVTLCVDELEVSLHPTLVKNILSLFNNPDINQNGAQLIFTSHAFYLMNGENLTRDQICLVEKSDGYSSSLKSLREFNETRKNKSFAETYIMGEYGAIPEINF